MTIIGLILVLAILGLFAWAITKYVPMPEGVRAVIIVTVVLFAIVLVADSFGLFGALNQPIRGLR